MEHRHRRRHPFAGHGLRKKEKFTALTPRPVLFLNGPASQARPDCMLLTPNARSSYM